MVALTTFRTTYRDEGKLLKGDLSIEQTRISFSNGSSNVLINGSDLINLSWVRGYMRNALMAYTVKKTYIFGDLDAELQDEVGRKVESLYNIDMVTGLEPAIEGDTAGELDVISDQVQMVNKDGKLCFSLPINEIAQSSVIKNELDLQFKHLAPTSLSEIKFHTLAASAEPDAENVAEIIDGKVKELNSALSSVGEEILRLDSVSLVAPRGKYHFTFMDDRLKLNGRSFDHVIGYENIQAAICLPHRASKMLYIVLKLDVPLKQNQSYYQYLCMQIPLEAPLKYTMLMPIDKVEQLHGDKLSDLQELQTSTRMVTRILSTLLDKEVLQIHENFEPISCMYKATNVFLFFLEDAIVFAPKLHSYTLVGKIRSVILERTSMDGNYFDASIILADMPQIMLTNISQSSNAKFFQFFAMHDIPTNDQNESMPKRSKSSKNAKAGGSSDEDEDDDDDESGSENDEDEGSDSQNDEDDDDDANEESSD